MASSSGIDPQEGSSTRKRQISSGDQQLRRDKKFKPETTSSSSDSEDEFPESQHKATSKDTASFPDTYRVRKTGETGFAYQKDLTHTLFVAESIEPIENCSFRLAKEMMDVHPFDDAVLLWEKSNKEKEYACFIQALSILHCQFRDRFNIFLTYKRDPPNLQSRISIKYQHNGIIITFIEEAMHISRRQASV